MVLSSSASQLKALLFTDIAGSTDFKSRLGSAAFAGLVSRHDAIFRSILADIAGAEIVNDLGDGFMACFPTASQAVEAALRFQYAITHEKWRGEPLRVRMGLHLGEVMPVEDDRGGLPKIVGLAADIAARVMGLALPGQILLTRAVFDEARQYVREHPTIAGSGNGVIALRWMAHGPYVFRGVDEPLEIFEVGAEATAPLVAPPDVEKARRSVSLEEEETLGWRPAAGLEVPGRPGWRLDRELGTGGFGEVWLGVQERTHERRVFKFCFDPERLRSFRRELTLFRLLREALGDRADIARLYEVQLDRAPYFLESEYSEHGNLNEWSTAQGGIRSVDLPTRLEIVARVAEAVAAAHSVGVLHKDIKPSNILMYCDADGSFRPRIADFGIGVLTNRTALEGRNITVAGFTVSHLTEHSSSRTGTRMYAPPESMLDQPFTTKGDVYALGVLLYQMIVGDLQRPLSPGWERDVADPILRGDIADCVAGDLERRMGDPAELANRLRTLPARRRARFRRQLASYSMFALIALWVLIFVAVAWVLREHDLRLRAEDAERLATAQKTEAEKQAAMAQATTEFLTGMFELANPSHGQGNRDILVRQVLDASAERLEHDVQNPAGKTALVQYPEVEAAVRQTMGMTYHGLGMYSQAEKHLNRALEIRRKMYGDDHEKTAETVIALASLNRDQGRFPEAESLARQAVGVLEKSRGPKDPDAIRAHVQLGDVYQEMNRAADALEQYNLALDRAREALGPEHETTLIVMMDLALTYQTQGEFDKARALYDTLIPAAVRVYGDDHVETLTMMNNLAVLHQYEGNYEEAAAVFQKVLDGRIRKLGENHPMTLVTMNNLAAAYSRLGRIDDAESLFTKAAEQSRAALGPDHADTLRTVINLAQVKSDLGKANEAEPMLRQAFDVATRTLGETHSVTRTALSALASALERQDRKEEAAALYRRVIELDRQVEGPEHPNTLVVMSDLAGLYHQLKRDSEAEQLYNEVLEIRSRTVGEDHLDTLILLNNMAVMYRDMGELEKASQYMTRAIAGARKTMPAGHWVVGAFLTSQGKLQTRLKEFEASEKSLLEAHKTMVATFGKDNDRTRDVVRALHALYEAWAKPDEAKKWMVSEAADEPAPASESTGAQQQ